MVSKEYTIKNKVGLHARPASLFVKKAGEFKSDIVIEAKGKNADGKSILSLMTMGIGQGTEITISADGEDEQQAVSELINILDSFKD